MYNVAMMSFRRISKVLLLVLPMAMSLPAEDAPLPIVNGKQLTQAEFDALLKVAPPDLTVNVGKDPAPLLRYYGMLQRVSEMAEKAKLSEDSALKEELRLTRMTILTNATFAKYLNDHPSTPDDQEKYYAEHLADYTSALVKVVYIPIGQAGEENVANAKAQSLVKQLAMGAEFDELAEKYPLAGFPNVIKKSDRSIPEAIRTAVFALKKNGVTAPIALPNGVYLFRLQDLSVKALNDVRGDVELGVSNDRSRAWMLAIDKSITVEIPPAK